MTISPRKRIAAAGLIALILVCGCKKSDSEETEPPTREAMIKRQRSIVAWEAKMPGLKVIRGRGEAGVTKSQVVTITTKNIHVSKKGGIAFAGRTWQQAYDLMSPAVVQLGLLDSEIDQLHYPNGSDKWTHHVVALDRALTKQLDGAREFGTRQLLEQLIVMADGRITVRVLNDVAFTAREAGLKELWLAVGARGEPPTGDADFEFLKLTHVAEGRFAIGDKLHPVGMTLQEAVDAP